MPSTMSEREVRKPREAEEAVQVRRKRPQRIVFVLLAALIASAPLPLGAARPLAWNLLGLGVALLLIASLAISTREPVAFQKDLAVPIVLFAVVAAFVVFQVSTGTPAAWRNPVWDQAAEGLGHEVQGAIAVDRQAALTYLLRLVSYAGIILLSFILCRNTARARAAVKCIVLCGSAYAAYGLAVYWSGNTTILWLTKWAYGESLTATFVNRNSAATYFGLCTTAALCQLAISFGDLRLFGGRREKLTKVAEFLSGRSWLLVCLFLLVTALLLTHSRGGFLSTLGGWLALAFALYLAPGQRQARKFGAVGSAVVMAAAAFMIVVALLISGGSTAQRLAETESEGGRAVVFGLTEQAISDHPIVGTGLGSFASVFQMYRTPSVDGYYDKAHNDYVQNLLELGVPAASCLFAAILWLVGVCARGVWTRHRNVAFPCLGIGTTALVALHATVDFSLQIPAVTATYMFLLGAAVAQSRSSRVW